MTRVSSATGLFLLCALSLGHCEAIASRSASELVNAMRDARDSDGFEIRIALRAQSAGSAAELIRIALIGQSGEDRDRLLVRAITPVAIRDRSIVSERVGDHVQSTAYASDAMPASTPADPMAGIFVTGLVVWDLMAPWWAWPEQLDEGAQTVGGHSCTQIRSRPDRRNASPVREALSCVDARNGLSWKTMLFDGHHHLLRSIEVTRAIRTQAGHSAARSASITDAQGNVTLVDVYSGDEHYRIGPQTFDAPAAPAPKRD